MVTDINQRVSVVTVFDKNAGTVRPYSIVWEGKTYKPTHFGHHHRIRDGRNIIHVFHTSTDSLSFRLRLDTDTLQWILEQTDDGN